MQCGPPSTGGHALMTAGKCTSFGCIFPFIPGIDDNIAPYCTWDDPLAVVAKFYRVWTREGVVGHAVSYEAGHSWTKETRPLLDDDGRNKIICIRRSQIELRVQCTKRGGSFIMIENKRWIVHRLRHLTHAAQKSPPTTWVSAGSSKERSEADSLFLKKHNDSHFQQAAGA